LTINYHIAPSTGVVGAFFFDKKVRQLFGAYFKNLYLCIAFEKELRD